MKNSSQHARKLSALLKQLAGKHKPEPIVERDAITHLVIGMLQWESSRKSADAAHHRLMRAMVDVNDLRVSHPHEVAAVLGERYPRGAERAARMHDVLQEIYVREHAVSLAPLADKGKKEARAYLDSLPGMTPYAAAYTTLVAFAGHAIPVDDQLTAMLREAGVAEETAPPREVEGFLEHHTAADDALQTHLLLQDWSDAGGPVKVKKKPPKK